jgi:hypothetical protein
VAVKSTPSSRFSPYLSHGLPHRCYMHWSHRSPHPVCTVTEDVTHTSSDSDHPQSQSQAHPTWFLARRAVYQGGFLMLSFTYPGAHDRRSWCTQCLHTSHCHRWSYGFGVVTQRHTISQHTTEVITPQHHMSHSMSLILPLTHTQNRSVPHT